MASKTFIETLARVAPLAGVSLLTAAGSAGISYGLDKLQDKKNTKQVGLMRGPIFEQMLAVHPQLREYDQERVKLYYDQLWHFSPSVASNPPAAANYVLSALAHDNIGGPPIASIDKITQIESRLNPFGPGSRISERLMSNKGIGDDRFSKMFREQGYAVVDKK